MIIKKKILASRNAYELVNNIQQSKVEMQEKINKKICQKNEKEN